MLSNSSRRHIPGPAFRYSPSPLVLVARAGPDDIGSVLREGEQPSPEVHQSQVSRLELTRRQEVPLALADVWFDSGMDSEFAS